MNPDLQNAINAGHSIVSVYVTAGQASGAGFGHLHRPDYVRMCAAEFAYARQNGIKAAYALMANVTNATWSRHLVVVDPQSPTPHTVEQHVLDQDPRIHLLFMNIPDGGSQVGKCPYEPYANALSAMYDDPTQVTNTIQPDCGPAQGFDEKKLTCNGQELTNPFECNSFEGCNPTVPVDNYDHQDVVAVLTGIIARYQPTVIRTLDPQPFSLCDPRPCAVHGDNTDHTATARFADEAITAYHGPHRTGRVSVIHYKGYGFADYPANLSTTDAAAKHRTAMAYKPFDPNFRTNPKNYDGFYPVTYERYPASTQWIERASNNRLVAVTIEDHQVKIWSENSVGGAWTGPATMPAPAPLAPSITLLKRPDGKLQIFALQLPLERETWKRLPASTPPQAILTAVQNEGVEISFGSWQSLGQAGPANGRLNGVPTAVFDGTGRAFVFTKDTGGKIEFTYATGSTWAAWAPIAASEIDIIDGIAAIARDDGGVEVFATGRDGQIQRFVQSGTDPTFTDQTASFPYVAASAPTVTKNADGRLEIFYREITAGKQPNKSGRVVTAWVDTTGSWLGGVQSVDGMVNGDAGTGPIAAIRRGGSGHIMLFERNGDGRVSATWQQGPNLPFILQWAVPGGPGTTQLIQEYPSAATDGLGRVVLIAKGSDGRMYINREAGAESIGSFSGWTMIGT